MLALALLQSLSGCGCSDRADPIPLSAVTGSSLSVRTNIVGFDPVTLSLTMPEPECPSIQGELSATLNGQPLRLRQRGGESFELFFQLPIPVTTCVEQRFAGGERFELDRPVDVEMTDGITTVSASFPPFHQEGRARLRRDGGPEQSEPLLVGGVPYVLKWSADTPFIDQVQRVWVALVSVEAPLRGDGGVPFSRPDPRASFETTHDQAARETRFVVDLPPGFEEASRDVRAPSLALVASYGLTKLPGFSPMTRCEGVAHCTLQDTDGGPEVKFELPIRVVPEPPAGNQDGACYGNGTCNAGLRCRKELCVR